MAAEIGTVRAIAHGALHLQIDGFPYRIEGPDVTDLLRGKGVVRILRERIPKARHGFGTVEHVCAGYARPAPSGEAVLLNLEWPVIRHCTVEYGQLERVMRGDRLRAPVLIASSARVLQEGRR